MMTDEDLGLIMQSALDRAKHVFSKDGALLPMAFLFGPGMEGKKHAVGVMPMPYTNDDEKALFAEVLKFACRQMKAFAVIMVSKVWFTTKDLKDLKGFKGLEGSVNEQLDRREAISVQGHTLSGSKCLMQPFTRDEGGQIIFGDLVELNTPTYDRFTETALSSDRVLH